MSKKAVLIGINYKLDTSAQLRGCINDTQHIYNMLTQHFGYHPQNIKVITEESAILPFKKNILQAINWLVRDNQAGDNLFFYYSGHGSQELDSNDSELDGKNEVIVPLDYKTSGVINDNTLYSLLAQPIVKDANLVSVIDCCHSATMLDLKYNFVSLTKPKNENTLSKMYQTSEWTDIFQFYMEKSHSDTIQGNVMVISGSLDWQTASDAYLNNKYQGALTFCFLETIRSQLLGPGAPTQFMKWKYLLKDIMARLHLTGFASQMCHFSSNSFESFNKRFKI
jgi:metacaspase-1